MKIVLIIWTTSPSSNNNHVIPNLCFVIKLAYDL